MTKEVVNKTIFHLTQEEKNTLMRAYAILEEISNVILENDDKAEFFASPKEIDLFDDLWCVLDRIHDKLDYVMNL